MARFDIEQFIRADPAAVDPHTAQRHLLSLGDSLADSVGYELTADGTRTGVWPALFRAQLTDCDLTFNPNSIKGCLRVAEADHGDSGYVREATLPIAEFSPNQTNIDYPSVLTKTVSGIEVVKLFDPHFAELDRAVIGRGYATAQRLAKDVLHHYGISF